jgi:hypothetical protein
MSKDRSLVRASDIGAWAYCSRAWFLAKVKGVAHQRPEVLAQGTAAHVAQGRSVRRAGQAQRVGLILAAAGAILALIAAVIGFLR